MQRLIADLAADSHVRLPLNQCMKKSDATDQIKVLLALDRGHRDQNVVLSDALEDGSLLRTVLIQQRFVLEDQVPVALGEELDHLAVQIVLDDELTPSSPHRHRFARSGDLALVAGRRQADQRALERFLTFLHLRGLQLRGGRRVPQLRLRSLVLLLFLEEEDVVHEHLG